MKLRNVIIIAVVASTVAIVTGIHMVNAIWWCAVQRWPGCPGYV